MARLSDVAPEYLKECFTYDSESGVIVWKKRPRSHFRTDQGWKCTLTRDAGTIAGAVTTGGYLVVRINNRLYKAHRIAWALEYGSWPHQSIDHINGNTQDNRISNLRDVAHAENLRNRGATKTNKIGIKGVDRRAGSYRARIKNKDGKTITIGSFSDPVLAHAAYCDYADKLHGKFANHG